MFEDQMRNDQIGTKIKIIGVGGAGGNVINDMIDSGIVGVEYVVVNTDEQDLKKSKAKKQISIGHLGAGADPKIAEEAAQDNEKISEIKKEVKGQDMIFITAGMGGGTGTGASPIVAKVAKEEGVLTVAIVTKPYKFEGKKRESNSEYGIEELKKYVDTLIVIPNDKLLELPDAAVKSFHEQLKASNEILRNGVKGITELITKEGVINLDFSDVKSIMKDSGLALFGFAESVEGEPLEALVERAISNPLLERDIKGATKMLVNITSGANMTILDVQKIQTIISERASGIEGGVDNLIFGSIYEEGRNNIILSIIATGFNDEDKQEVFDNLEYDNLSEGLFNTDEDKSGFFVPKFKEGE